MDAAVRILLVEDDEDDFILVRDLLAKIPAPKYLLDWTTEYDAAFKKICAKQHDVYLVDHRLGKRTGLELVRGTIAAGCLAPIILLTGQEDYQIDIEAMKAGVADYLVKGQINAALLDRAIRYALERMRAEQTLQAERNKLKSIHDGMPYGVSIINQLCEFEYVNPALEKEFGPVEGRKCHDYFHERNEVCPWCQKDQVFAGNPQRQEFFFPKTGKTFDFFHTPLRNADNTLSLLQILQDITERKRVENALKETERKLRLITESMSEVILAYDLNRRLIYVNPAIEKMTGYSIDEIRESGFLQRLHPGDAAAMKVYFEDFSPEDLSSNFEFRIVAKDRRILWCRGTWSPLQDENEQRIGKVIVVREVTSQKTMEQEVFRLLGAVEQIADGVVIMDMERRVVYANAAFEAFHDLPRKLAFGRRYDELIREGGTGLKALAGMGNAIKNGKVWSGHWRGKKREGLELDVTFSPVRDSSGTISHYVAVERDTTAAIKLQEQIRQGQKTEALGTLAGGIAHDFNNILMPIMINTDLALLDVQEGKSPSIHYLQTITEAAIRGQQLVKRILAFTRRPEHLRKPIKIAPLVREAMQFLRASIPKNIEIREELDEGSGFVLADPTQIHQVLMNLGSNAAHAMRRKGDLLEIKLAETAVDGPMAAQHPGLSPGLYLRLAMKDTGHGMSPDIREKAFDPFFTTKKPGEGTGMGLAIVQGIVKNHEGVITLESEVGKGTTFQIFLPLTKGEAEPEVPPVPSLPTGKEKILLIDDEEIQVRSLKSMLARLGYRTTGKTDAREALEIFRAHPESFDLVITDQTMPHMTGDKLAREMLRIRPDLPIILCTGFSDLINEEEAKALGIRDFSPKPLNVRDLAERIRAALKGNSPG